MSIVKALIAYEGFFRGLQRTLMESQPGLEAILETGLGYLSKELNLTHASFYTWNQSRHSLQNVYAYHMGTLMEGEEEIVVAPGSELSLLIENKKPVVLSERKPWIAFIPLATEDRFIGAVRVERKLILPRGQILLSMPRFSAKNSQADYPLLEDIGSILSVKLVDVFRDEQHRRKNQYLKASSEVSAAAIGTPRMKEMFELVSSSILKNLGFDRIRFYAVDQGRTELQGILGRQIPDRKLDLSEEKYTLEPHVNSLVDAIMAGSIEVSVTAGGKVVYIPLLAKGQVIGCMAVDNLLSQQSIADEQILSLKSLGHQIGMAVLNSRLFEDIEQQAITDGLTKLYVFRYFKQRLKEEIDRADRYSYSVALVMLDVDDFKNLNDSHGHLLGDKVLEMLAQHIRGNIRRIDLAARYGGDEFILLLPEITEQEAWLMGWRLLNSLKQNTLKSASGDPIDVVVTLGVAMYPTDAVSGRDLIEAADKALYWAKKNNRGDLCFYKNISQKEAQSG